MLYVGFVLKNIYYIIYKLNLCVCLCEMTTNLCNIIVLNNNNNKHFNSNQ